MTLISGIPPWLIMYFENLQKDPAKIKEIFPNLQLIVTGGVNYEALSGKKMNSLLGGTVDIVQRPFRHQRDSFAYQNNYKEDGLLY